MGWLRKKAKQIGNVFKKIGKKLKKGLGKIAKAFGKLGPLGSLALSFILPGLGSAIGGWLSGPSSGIFGTIFNGVKTVASGIGGAVKGAFGKVWNTVSGAIEGGLNKIGNVFSKGSDIGTGLKNWIGEVVNGKQTVVDGEVVTNATGEVVEEVASGTIETVAGEASEKVVEEVAGKTAKRGVGDSVVSNLKDPKIGLKDSITRSKEYSAYKKIQPVTTAGQQMVAAEEKAEADYQRALQQQSDYFKGQADSQLYAVEQQNYSRSSEQPQFVNFADFNPQQDPAGQYLAYRGIQGNINPVDVGGYGFDYEAFLRAQLGGRAYA